MSMDTGFAIYAAFCICLGIFGLWAANESHKRKNDHSNQ